MRSATDPGSTASTLSACVSPPRCAGASRYSCTALRTYADAENCFLFIEMPLAQAASEIVQAGENRHDSGHVKEDVQLRHGQMPPVHVQNRNHGGHLHHCARLSV